MACIRGNKLTKEHIHATKVFSANLVTEEMLPLADYLGNKEGYEKDKMAFSLDGGKVFLCKIRNVLMEEG